MRVVVALAFAVCGSSAFAQTAPELFVYGADGPVVNVGSGDQSRAVSRRTRVSMRLDVLFDGQRGRDAILLNADDQRWAAHFVRLDVDDYGFRSWVGRIDGMAESHVVFTERDGVVSGLIDALGTSYQIRTERPGEYVLERIDVDSLGAERDPLPGNTPAQTGGDGGRNVAADDAGTIDVLVLYSPAARSRMGNTAQMEAIASQVISDTNTAFARSGVAARTRLVGAFELQFIESPQMSSDLPALKNSSDARILRNVVRADLVQLLVSSPDQASCGIAYLLSPETPDFDAYSIADVSCIPQYTPTHELAHNMGSHHAPEDGASGALFPYSYAYKDPQRGFRTVMAYPCVLTTCVRILNFSTPRVLFEGAVTGTSLQDNARSINEAAPFVANFRSSTGEPSIPPRPPTGLNSTVVGNSVTVTWNPASPEIGFPSSSATSYVLQAGAAPGASNLFNASVGAATSASGLLGVGTYYWRVIALNPAGASAPSAEAQFVVGGCVLPAPPTEFRFSVNARLVTMTWNAAVGGTAPPTYVLEAGSATTLSNLLVAAVGGETTVVTPAPPGTYYVRVRAQNLCGVSAASNEQLIVVP